jgi:hypothetical protein
MMPFHTADVKTRDPLVREVGRKIQPRRKWLCPPFPETAFQNKRLSSTDLMDTAKMVSVDISAISASIVKKCRVGVRRPAANAPASPLDISEWRISPNGGRLNAERT